MGIRDFFSEYILTKKVKFSEFVNVTLTKILLLMKISVRYETVCEIWYHLHNLKNMKNTHGRVSPPSVFLRFVDYINGTKSHKASRMFTTTT